MNRQKLGVPSTHGVCSAGDVIVHDKPVQRDRSHHRTMAVFWASDVQIQFGKIATGGFYRPADKADIAHIVNRLYDRLPHDGPRPEQFPPFAWAALKCFQGSVAARWGWNGVITLQMWLVRMIRDLATADDMLQVENRFPNSHLLDGLYVPLAAHRRNLKTAGFGRSAKSQMDDAKGRHAKPVTLPVPPANTQEEEDAA